MDLRSAEKKIEAIKVLREQISDLAEGDEDFIRDTLEGEVDLEGFIDKLLFSIAADELLVCGIKTHIRDLDTRANRVSSRVASKRILITKALEISGVDTIECASATVTLKNIPASLVIKEESDIPSVFWKSQPLKLDRKSLLEALKNKETIEGASLSNGGLTIAIRTR